MISQNVDGKIWQWIFFHILSSAQYCIVKCDDKRYNHSRIDCIFPAQVFLRMVKQYILMCSSLC